MKDFFNRNKNSLLVIFIVGLFVYSIRMFFYTISIDTEVFMNTRWQVLDMWMSIGRYGLVGMKELLKNVPISITTANVLTFVLFYVSIIVWMINIEKMQKPNNKLATLIFGIAIIVSPIFAEQFGFTLQCLEIAFAFLLTSIGIFFQEKYLETNKLLYAIFTIILISFSFTCYQAFIFLYITICVFDYIIKYEGKMDYKLILKYLIIFAVSCVLYFGIGAILSKVLNVQKNSYLLNQIEWKRYGVVKGFIRTIILNVVTTSLFLGIEFDIILALIFILMTYYLLNKFKLKENKLFYLIYIFFFITPFITGIIKGGVEIYRAKFSLAFLISFILYYLINNVGEGKLRTILKYSVIVIVIVQTLTSYALFIIDYQRYKNDVATGTKINETVKNMDLSKPVVFVGKKEYKKYIIRGETLGHSFFEWDAKEAYGVNVRAIGFLKTIDIEYKSPSMDQIEKANSEAQEMPIWPEAGSIIEKGEYIIVNLGQ